MIASNPVFRIIFISLGILGLIACGGDDSDSDGESQAQTDSAGGEVRQTAFLQIVSDHCGGSDCHGSGSSYPKYVGDINLASMDKSAIIARVYTAKNMPPSYATDDQQTITSQERETIRTFLNSL